MEPLLDVESHRFNLLPIRHPETWKRCQAAEASFWTAYEVDLSNDLSDWSSLNDGERNFISTVLAFFASADGLVNDNLVDNFCREVQVREVSYFYDFQRAIENVHNLMYGRLIETYVNDADERERLFAAVEHVPCVRAKAAWATKWMDAAIPFAKRLVAFAVVEGVFFSGSFCAIFWFKHRRLLPGLCKSNELIARDEGMHQEFASFLYTHWIVGTLPDAEVHEVVREAVEIECSFCEDALPVSMIGMNAREMKQYIRFVADRLLTQLKCPVLYNASNPFEWMELISLQGKTNFFEHRVTEYKKSGVTEAQGTFQLDDDF